jgi:hypothetical protein
MDKGKEFYYSESKGSEIAVEDMSDTYVRRAFCKLLREDNEITTVSSVVFIKCRIQDAINKLNLAMFELDKA